MPLRMSTYLESGFCALLLLMLQVMVGGCGWDSLVLPYLCVMGVVEQGKHAARVGAWDV